MEGVWGMYNIQRTGICDVILAIFLASKLHTRDTINLQTAEGSMDQMDHMEDHWNDSEEIR